MRDIEKFYDKFTIFYPLVDLFLKGHRCELINIVNDLPNGKLLEIGVGTGSNLPFYNKHEITGIDISSKMLEAAVKKVNSNVRLMKMNAEELEFLDASLDYIVLSHVVAVVDNPAKVLNEVYRVLKSNGLLIVLNHFTPVNSMYYVDKLFNLASQYLYFKSLFRVDDLKSISKLICIHDQALGKTEYYRILIFKKV